MCRLIMYAPPVNFPAPLVTHHQLIAQAVSKEHSTSTSVTPPVPMDTTWMPQPYPTSPVNPAPITAPLVYHQPYVSPVPIQLTSTTVNVEVVH